MNRRTIFLILFSLIGPLYRVEALPKPTEESVKTEMKRVADWQMANMEPVYDKKFLKRPYRPTDWQAGALYVGMLKWAALADDDSYYEWLKAEGDKAHWKLGKRKYHADDHCTAYMYIELSRKFNDPTMITASVANFDYLMANSSSAKLKWKSKGYSKRWSWCDALFMSPPVWAQLSSITGDPAYLDWMVSEYKATTDFLFDADEKLYFRDSRFFDQRHNGHKIFWSRGNGWVFGGLAMILPELTKGSAEYDYFVGMYKTMAQRLVELQTPEGYWPMSLLEADAYPQPETSGTGFFCFGFAWGINNGILDRATYEPVVLKAWSALTRCITDDGMLGYVQPIGALPGEAWPDKTEIYGTGAFLAAGSEVCRLLNPSD